MTEVTRSSLITGGAGFIGVNLADRLLARGEQVVVYDNLSRPSSDKNIAWLRSCYDARHLLIIQDDVRNFTRLCTVAEKADVIYHLAGQVAVTTSVQDPRSDFECNALGTFNALEAARLSPKQPAVLYASTNKVYGGMKDVPIVEHPTRYAYRDLPYGVSEQQLLDFHSPYGCSKGAGDQYVQDYARIYGLRTVVFRQSCIYGPHQMGIEDQGWLAWFAVATLTERPITIYGDGKQVRDVLYIDDLLDVYDAALQRIEAVTGSVYNIGGGPDNAISVWSEYRPLLEKALGQRTHAQFSSWRPGDQRVYISDIRKAKAELGWSPRVGLHLGIDQMVDWLRTNSHLFDA